MTQRNRDNYTTDKGDRQEETQKTSHSHTLMQNRSTALHNISDEVGALVGCG